MNRSFAVTVGFAALTALSAAGLSGCSAAKEEKAVASTSTTTSSSTVTSAASTTSATTASSSQTPAGSTTPSTTPTSTAETSTTAAGPMVGGMTECTKAALAEPATQAAQSLGPDNLYNVDTLDCADGWAVTGGVLAGKDNPGMGAPTSFVFQQEGQFWVLQDKAKVCGTNPVTTTPPADATIPAALFLSGCAAG